MSPELSACAPNDVSLLDHCRRVAAVAQCVAHQMFLAAPVKVSVESAALLHHSPIDTLPNVVDGEALVPALLRAFHHAADAPQHLRRLAEIIHIANRFDELYELCDTEPRSPAEIIAELRRVADRNSWSMDPVKALETVARGTDVQAFAKSPLPVFPQAVLRILQLLDRPESTAGQIDRIAAADPVVAGNLVRVANSPLFMGYEEVSTIRSAVMRLGYVTTRKIVLASIFRPLFTRPSLRMLLPHALEAAELAHHLAARSPAVDPEEAFLCGLLHDVGKLLLDRLNLFDSATMRGLLDHGCPPVYAENLIGCDHGKAGADIAAHWRLPARHVEAIRYHHQPERIDSPLVRLLYLVEWRLGHLEDLTSAHRVDLCMRSLGVTDFSLESWHNEKSPLALIA
ncbi:MAG TPA: HDOD domain-containing protein [Bryobacteraceae bacterium]|nr:HDOD domain-containing protein [Bryobacteraceae bacterium]